VDSPKKLKHSFVVALFALGVALMAAVVATFAWYIYNTNAHTTNVHMAAGAGVSLQISTAYEGPYSSSAVLQEFVGTLNPVSTNNIMNGFQKVFGFTNGNENQPLLVANLFGKSEASDYYRTSLYFKTNGDVQNVYLSNIAFEDSDANKPISTAIRVGFVAHNPGKNMAENAQYMSIFAINDAKNPEKQYNTATGSEGSVLDSTRDDGTTVVFTPYTKANFCDYDSNSGVTKLRTDSRAVCQVPAGTGGEYGEAVQLDVYIWLEGCDEDCTINLSAQTLKNLALSFAAYPAA